MERDASTSLDRSASSASDFSDASNFDAALSRDRKGPAHGDSDDLYEDTQQADFITGVWGVIYTVSREKKISWAQVAFKLTFDCLQLLLLTINATYGWDIDGRSTWWQVVSFVQLNQFMADRGIIFFLTCFYIFSFLLLMTLVLCVWVAHAFRSNRFDFVWPITFLRWFSNIFFQILDIASMTLFFMVMDCQYHSSDPESRYYNQEFPDQQCWTMPYMIHVIVGAGCIILFVTMATLFQMGEMETNPTTNYQLATGHSKVEVIGFLCKFFMTSCSVFVTNLKWLSICYTLGAWLLVYLFTTWVPHYSYWVNIVRSGTYGAVLYSAIAMAAMTWATGVDQDDQEALSRWKTKCTIALVAGLVPSAMLAAALAHARLQYLLHNVVDKFRCSPPDFDINQVHRFSDPREVEICARCLQVWKAAPDGKVVLDLEAVDLAEVIIKVGIAQFKSDPYAHILYAGFLVDVRQSIQNSLVHISTAKKSRPSILESFAIFSLEQQRAQTDCTTGSDLLSYVQMQRNLRLATKVYNDSLQSMSTFWQLLLRHEVQFEDLIECVKQVDARVTSADEAYKELFQSTVESWRILRVYAQYLEVIKMDATNAAKWNAEADEMAAEEEEGSGNLFSTMNIQGRGSDESVTRNRAIFDDQRCAVVVNAFGIITMANKAAFKMFGCKMSDMVGKNVRILMPSPFKERHDQYMKAYAETGKPKTMGRTLDMVGQHFDGRLFSMQLTVSKVSGLGMDSNYMGVMEPVPETDCASVWLMNDGTVMCIAEKATQWFGYGNNEIAKTSFLTYVVDASELEEMLKVAAETMKEGVQAVPVKKTWHLDSVSIKHKYLDDAITCSMDMSTGGTETQRFVLLSIRRTSPTEPVLVVNNSGRIVHVCDDTAAAVGVTPSKILTETSILSLIPEPFSLVHTHYLMRGIDPDPSDPPPFSCRSGLSMSLNVTMPRGTELHPFNVKFVKKVQKGDGLTLDVVSLTKRTMQQALGERCLSVLVDTKGTVRRVAGGQDKLFGFKPEELLNKPVSSFLDIMATTGSQDSSEVGHDFSSQALEELANRSVTQPGDSYRVGVVRPYGDKGGDRSALVGGIVSHLRAVMKVPAIMKAVLHCLDDEISELQEGSKTPLATPFFDLQSIPEGSEDNFMIELQLWKAETMTGVLILDEQGIITSTALSPLYPADLMFGVAASSMVKRHINCFLPLHDRPIGDLFDPINTEQQGPKKGGMKGKDNSWLRRGPGVVNQLEAVHGTDRQPLQLSVQAVALKGKRGSMGLIVHLHKPETGRNKPFLLPQTKVPGSPEPPEAPTLPSGLLGPPPSLEVLPLQGFRSLTDRQSLSARGNKKTLFSSQNNIRFQKPSAAMEDEAGGQEFSIGTIGGAGVAMPATLRDHEDSMSSNVDLLTTTQATDQLKLHLVQRSSIDSTHRDKDMMRVWIKGRDVTGNAAVPTPDRSCSRPSPSPDLAAPSPGSFSHVQPLPPAEEDHWEGSETGTDLSGNSNDAGFGGSYKRGKRFKRLLRLLHGAASLQVVNRFFYKAAATTIFICTVTIACFVAAYMLILDQSTMVKNMQNLGFAANAMGKIAIYVDNLRLLFGNHHAPWLDSLNSQQDVWFHAAQMTRNAAEFAVLHKLANGFINDLPNVGSSALDRLTEIWDTQSIPITRILPSTPVISPETINMTLWDAGQAIINKAHSITYMVSQLSNRTTADDMVALMVDMDFIMNNVQATLVPAYTEVMDNFLEVVIAEANSVNEIHYYFLVIEGCVSTALALFVMLISTTQIVVYRWNIYNVFMMIPTTIIRNIVSRMMSMMDDAATFRDHLADMEQVEQSASEAPEVAVMKQPGKDPLPDQPNRHNHDNSPTINLASSSAMSVQDISVWGILKSTCISLKCWGKRRRVSPLSGKKTLVRSFRLIAWFLVPFAVWGIMMIVINVTAHQQLSLVASPIALFNLINYNIVAFYRHQIIATEIILEDLPEEMPKHRLDVVNFLPNALSDYTAMLHGNRAVLDTSPHVRFVKQGILDTDFGKNILYDQQECLRLTQSTCLPPEHSLYGYTHSGLDALFNRYFEVLRTMVSSGGLTPLVDSEEFNFVYTTYYDISGGLLKVGASYYDFVASVYDGVMMTHIVGLILTLILMAGFALFILWPFVKTCKVEGRRIADLLSQLPTDIDVEALVRKAAVAGGSSIGTGLLQTK